MLNKFPKQARREKLTETIDTVQHKRSKQMQYVPSQYLKAESELTKLASENYPHNILYWMNDITTFNQKRQRCSNTKWVSLKMGGVQLFQVCLLTNERSWYHSGTEKLRCTKDCFYFYPQIFPCLLAVPLYLEMRR